MTYILAAIVAACALLIALGGLISSLRRDRDARRIWLGRFFVMAVTAAIVLMPSTQTKPAEQVTQDLDVVFVIDSTSSIAAEDCNAKPRITCVRKDVGKLLNQFAGARFSVVTFDRTIVQRLPFTEDANAVNAAVGALSPEITIYSKGSSIDQPLPTMKKIAAQHKTDRRLLFVYMGDGEQTAQEKPRSFSSLGDSHALVAVVGYGTAAGGKMRETSGWSGDDSTVTYIEDKSGEYPYEDAISKIDEGNLRRIAEQVNGQYLHSSGDIEERLTLKSSSSKKGGTAKTRASIGIEWIVAIPAAIISLLYISLAMKGRAQASMLRRIVKVSRQVDTQ